MLLQLFAYYYTLSCISEVPSQYRYIVASVYFTTDFPQIALNGFKCYVFCTSWRIIDRIVIPNNISYFIPFVLWISDVLDNPTLFTNPFQFQITCECLAPGVQEGICADIRYYHIYFINIVFDRALNNIYNAIAFKFIFFSELEWKLIYVGSAEDDKCDQTLDSILVGPVPIGTSKFVFQVRQWV